MKSGLTANVQFRYHARLKIKSGLTANVQFRYHARLKIKSPPPPPPPPPPPLPLLLPLLLLLLQQGEHSLQRLRKVRSESGATWRPIVHVPADVQLYNYCPPGAQVRHLATNTDTTIGGPENVSECTAQKLIKICISMLAQPQTWRAHYRDPCNIPAEREGGRVKGLRDIQETDRNTEIQKYRNTETQKYRQTDRDLRNLYRFIKCCNLWCRIFHPENNVTNYTPQIYIYNMSMLHTVGLELRFRYNSMICRMGNETMAK